MNAFPPQGGKKRAPRQNAAALRIFLENSAVEIEQSDALVIVFIKFYLFV